MSVALPPGPFSVIYADPPWRFATFSPKGRGRCPDGDVGAFHYETMPLADILAMPVRRIAAKPAVLYLWATAPMMPQALQVMSAWGFTYKSQLVWDKERVGTGYWVRGQHELLLIGAAGSGMCPPPALRGPSVIRAPAREHSRKPDEARERIERHHPGATRIELFAREARPGWTAWGDQVGAFDMARAA